MHRSPFIRLICGYTGSGKDALGLYLNTGSSKYSWAVYGHPTNKIAFPKGHGCRIAMADAVKKEVKRELGYPDDYDLDPFKDKVLVDGRTFRSFCIEKGCGVRAIDPYYWARQAFTNYNTSEVLTVTDWRFLQEQEYALSLGDIATIRVFRKDVPIPPITVPEDDPEHSLDHVMTDFLVVPSLNHQEEIVAARRVFPQYQDFVYIDTLN